jgi:hypothetical protein
MRTNIAPQVATQIDYLQEAFTHYQLLEPKFSTNDGYWMLGCILDSMIDFLDVAGEQGVVSYTDGRRFLQTVATTYIDNQKQGNWYDDWAWWGNSTGKIFVSQYDKLFGNDEKLRNDFLTICTDTFNFIKTGTAPYTPMAPCFVGTFNAYYYVKTMASLSNPEEGWSDLVTENAPVWNLGCWQAPMTPTSHNPNTTSLGPFQDSVINGLFYILSQRTLGHELGTQRDVDVMTEFYRSWMGMSTPSLAPDKQVYNRITPTAGLFRERVSMYKNGKPLNGYDANLAWTGDQGLMLSALTQLHATQEGAQQQATLNLIASTINGVCTYALGTIDANHADVIMPWCHVGKTQFEQPGQAPGGDTGDYYSGTGIFMRGLLDASAIPEIKQFIETEEIQKVLVNTANALSDGNTYMYFTCQKDLSAPHSWFDDFNKMATFLAASKLLKTS